MNKYSTNNNKCIDVYLYINRNEKIHVDMCILTFVSAQPQYPLFCILLINGIIRVLTHIFLTDISLSHSAESIQCCECMV